MQGCFVSYGREEELSNEAEKYICGVCRGEFEKGWPDEDARLESEGLFGPLSNENSAVICDDCFEELFPTVYAQTN